MSALPSLSIKVVIELKTSTTIFMTVYVYIYNSPRNKYQYNIHNSICGYCVRSIQNQWWNHGRRLDFHFVIIDCAYFMSAVSSADFVWSLTSMFLVGNNLIRLPIIYIFISLYTPWSAARAFPDIYNGVFINRDNLMIPTNFIYLVVIYMWLFREYV